MFVLFFAVRPMYILVENDYELFHELFLIRPDIAMIHRNLLCATLGLICFVGVGLGARKSLGLGIMARARAERAAGILRVPVISNAFANRMFSAQLGMLAVMYWLANWAGGLYGSAFGAYMYDLPAVLHGAQIVAMMLFLERYLQHRTQGRRRQFYFSGIILVAFTLLMRDVSMFRGFYLTGLMIAGIAFLARTRNRVGYAWLVIPIVGLLPLFKVLGSLRYEDRKSVATTIVDSVSEIFNPVSYWRFFDSKGDMNIFDSFVAASEAKVTKQPYVLSWLYVPVHLVPRKVWKSKPAQGLLQDHSFSNGAPYSPGIAGYFVLDGGRIWMLGCMAILGVVITWLDLLAIRIRVNFLRCCVYGVFVINAMFLTRFLLWQYTYQVLYMLVPSIVMGYLIRRGTVGLQITKAVVAANATQVPTITKT